MVLGALLILARDIHRPDPPAHHDRQKTGEAGALHPRQRAHAGEHSLIERLPQAHFLVLRSRQRCAQRQHAGLLKSRIDRMQPPQRPNQQAGCNQQRHRQRNLRDHQRRAQSLFPSSHARARALAQPGGPVAASAQRRKYSERQPGCHRDRDREQQDSSVDARIRHRKRSRHQYDQQRQGGIRAGNTERSAEPSQQKALRKQLPYEPLPSRSQRSPNGQFLLPGESARQQQIRQVGARNQQNARRSRKECHYQRPGLQGHLVAQIRDGGAQRAILLRILRRQPSGNQPHLLPRLFQADTRLAPRDGAQIVIVAIRQVRGSEA